MAALAWLKDKTKQVRYLRFLIQLTFLFIIYYVSIIAVWKGVLLLLIVAATAVTGRFFCGWICPFGFYMDLTTSLRTWLRIRHFTLPVKLNASLHKLRYLIALAIVLLALPPFLLGAATLQDTGKLIMLRGPFSPYTLLIEPLQTPVTPWVPPFGALSAINGQSISFPYAGEILAYLSPNKAALPLAFMFVAVTLTASFAVRRFWCRFCPTGISIGALNRFNLFKALPLLHLDKEGEKCTKCGICRRVCPVEVTEVYEKKSGKITTSMCMQCLRCVEMCPNEGCLNLKYADKTIIQSRNWLENQKPPKP